MALQLKPATVYAVLFCIIIFAQVKCSHAVTPAGVLVTRKLQQQVFFTAAGRETGAVVQNEVQHKTTNNAKVSVKGSMTPMVDSQLRTVPSGPDPLHHHREVPMRPETP